MAVLKLKQLFTARCILWYAVAMTFEKECFYLVFQLSAAKKQVEA